MSSLRMGELSKHGCHANQKTPKMVAKKLLSVYGLLKYVEFHQASGIIEVCWTIYSKEC
jgi:hypothetical protein